MNLDIGSDYLPLFDPPGSYEHYAFYGGRGGGKSHAIVESLVMHSCQREERIVCGRQFQNSIRESSKELIEQKIKKLNVAVYFKVTEREIVNLSTGSRFTFIGMDRNPESVKSLEDASAFWGEEAQTFTKKAVELIIPTIRKPRSRMLWSWNPRFRTDEVDQTFRGAIVPEKSYIKEVNFDSNPYFYLTRMPSEMRRSARVNPKRFSHIWRGGYDENPDAAIFPNWEIGRITPPEKCIPRYGMDFGFSSDPNFIVKAYVIPEEDIIYIAEEASGLHVPNNQLADLMDTISGVRDWPIIADNSRPETIDYLSSKGFNIYGAKKGAGSIKNGINFLTGYKLLIDPNCLSIIDEIKTYRWKMDPNDKPLPLPEPNQQDHGIDALRYAVEELSIHELADDGVDYV